MPRTLLHFRLRGERPACRPNEDRGHARPDLTSTHSFVTCRTCRRTLAFRGLAPSEPDE